MPQYKAYYRQFYLTWLLMLLVIILAAIMAYKAILSARFEPFEAEQALILDDADQTLAKELGYLIRIPLILRQNPNLRTSLHGGAELDSASIAQEFAYFAKISPLISQIRWLDSEGNERVRVNVDSGSTSIVAPDKLQTKSNRYYFRDTMTMRSDQVYVSPLDLNLEHGEPTMPLQPTVRIAVRTGVENGLRRGVLVVNYNLASLFEALNQPAHSNIDLQLIDHQGYWLIYPDTTLRWGSLRQHPEQRLPNYHPAIWQIIQGADRGTGIVSDDELWSFRMLPAGLSTGTTGEGQKRLTLIAVTNSQTAARIQMTTLLAVSGAAVILIILGALLAARIAHGRQREVRLSGQVQQEKEDLLKAHDNLLIAYERAQILQDSLVEARKLSSLGMMVAGVAHELNTPAGGAQLSINALKSDQIAFRKRLAEGISKEDLDRYLERQSRGIELASLNLARIIALVKSFKRLAIDRAHEAIMHFDLATLVNDLIVTMEPRLKYIRATIKTEVPTGLALESYQGILSQVLQNLIDNALQHGIDSNSPGVIQITAVAIDYQVQLEVRDNGRGIDPEIRAHIFDPFVTSGRGDGRTGLGMHLVYQWVTQDLQGSLKIASDCRKGTAIIIQIPRKLIVKVAL